MNEKKKLLFLNFDLLGGGAEKVLVSLVNCLDESRYDIFLRTIFNAGPNLKNLLTHIKYSSFFPFEFRGITPFQRLFTMEFLHHIFVGKEEYAIEIAYLESSPTRIIAGGKKNSNTKRIAWVHIVIYDVPSVWRSKEEMRVAYKRFDAVVFVSNQVKEAFLKVIGFDETELPCYVIHNVVEHDKILSMSKEHVEDVTKKGVINIVVVGKLLESKGVMRLLRIMNMLHKEGVDNWHLHFLGIGSAETTMRKFCEDANITEKVSFLGYQTNPYKYMKQMDLFVCASHFEGYSTATQEAFILNIPVLATDCGGMDEVLDAGRYGVLVKDDDSELKKSIKSLLEDQNLLQKYKDLAVERGKFFHKERLLKENEQFLQHILEQ